MPGNNTYNSDPVIRGIVHSEMLLKALEDSPLPDGLYRNVTDFGDGNTLQIPVLGEMELFDLVEEQPTPTSTLSTGTIGLNINRHKGVAGYVTDELKEDGYKAAAVEANIVPSSLRSLKEAFETDFLATALSPVNQIVTLNDPNTLASYDHRWIADGPNNTLTLEDFIYAKLSMDKAGVPEEGRIAIVDPIVEASILTNFITSSAIAFNPQWRGIVETGFVRGKRFVRNIFGFDVWVSNRLPVVASESITSTNSPGAASITNAVNNVFMCVADDMTKPIMGAMRRPPRVEGKRNTSERRDEYHTTARWGFGLQRGETLISVLSNRTQYK